VFLIGAFQLPRVLIWLASYPFFAPESFADFSVAFLLPGAHLLLTLSFLAAPGWWARLAFPDSKVSQVPPATYSWAAELLFAFVGLLVLVEFIPKAVEELAVWRAGPGLSLTPEQMRQEQLSALPHRLGLLASLVLGVALLLGRRGLAGMWRLVRTAGHKSEAA